MASKNTFRIHPDDNRTVVSSPPRTPSSGKSSVRFKSGTSSRTPLSARLPLQPCNSNGRTDKAILARKAAENETDAAHVAKYFARTEENSPLKSAHSSHTLGSSGHPVQRNATLSTIHISPPKRVRLRKYRTEPFILALRDELKKATGETPSTPEKNDNPFEPTDLPGTMSRAWLSPDVFNSLPDSSPSFKWSIDHMATLHPVEIGRHDIVRTEYLKHVQTESDEDDAQENIRKFFQEKAVHLPSPISYHGSPVWSSSSPDRLTEEAREFTRTRLAAGATVDAACQTDVEIPPDFDFERFFADFQTARQFRRCSSGSVRRRLFVCDMETSSDNLPWSDGNVSTGFIFGSQSSQPASLDAEMGGKWSL